jgi:hypothetical protein
VAAAQTARQTDAPAAKFHTSFPFVLRLAIALAVPMLFGCGCSMISTSGYSAMHFTALISTLFGYFLLRTRPDMQPKMEKGNWEAIG